MGYVALAATVISAAVSAASAIQQGNAASSAANYQAQVALNNQKIAARSQVARSQLSPYGQRMFDQMGRWALRSSMERMGLLNDKLRLDGQLMLAQLIEAAERKERGL